MDGQAESIRIEDPTVDKDGLEGVYDVRTGLDEYER